MKVYVVMAGVYDNYGLHGVFESRAAAEAAIERKQEYTEIEEVELRGMPTPDTSENVIDQTRRELGLQPR